MFSYEGLTRFEKTRILSARALQIAMGAPVLVRTEKNTPREIAKEEFVKGVLPITIVRHSPKRL